MKRADGTEQDPPSLDDSFAIGKVRVLREGRDGLLLGCGMTVPVILEAADILAEAGRAVTVVDVSTIKPLDPGIVELAARAPVVLTVENHSVIGGLGSAVAELLMEAGVAKPFARVGVQDVFAEGGTTPFLFDRYGLSAKAVVAAFHRKRGSGVG
ncbi:transketolase C-terminal domain-containing protein [Bosea sp. UC22_33]|uniref:transketolase C-terminal domain-containing protein n=1 Tax=Bosea sp. UC22_33 TaxID=3350165 RepID=UPI00366DE7D0